MIKNLSEILKEIYILIFLVVYRTKDQVEELIKIF